MVGCQSRPCLNQSKQVSLHNNTIGSYCCMSSPFISHIILTWNIT
uniref:Uncharacterized protein n=1 Tax=Anguilla anguilla TaxID=7936 RepID=A0A0E9V1L7_ANGAN